MGQRGMWTDWTATVAQRLPSLSQSQAKVLAAFGLGVALTQRCTLRAVAEALARWGKPDTVERRLPRFLPHPRLDWQACLLAFAAWEELALRDFKSTGWQWQRSHVRTLGAANRLWLVRATAYA